MSGTISIAEIIDGYSIETFNDAKVFLKQYLRFHSNVGSSYDKNMMVEKTCDYVEMVEISNKILFPKLLISYLEILHGLMVNKIEKSSRAEEYFKRANKIYQSAKKKPESLTQEDLNNFTRVFLCIYNTYLLDEKKISEIDFFIEDVDLRKILLGISNETKSFPIPLGIEIKKLDVSDRYSKAAFSVLMLIIVSLDIIGSAPQYEV